MWKVERGKKKVEPRCAGQAWGVLNGFPYANNDPLLYYDPSGHCVNGDIECRDELRETEKKYHVAVSDKGGHWTAKGLNAIARGMKKFKNRMGDARFERLFSGVTFSVGGNPNGMGTTGHRDVEVGGNVMNDRTMLRNILCMSSPTYGTIPAMIV